MLLASTLRMPSHVWVVPRTAVAGQPESLRCADTKCCFRPDLGSYNTEATRSGLKQHFGLGARPAAAAGHLPDQYYTSSTGTDFYLLNRDFEWSKISIRYRVLLCFSTVCVLKLN